MNTQTMQSHLSAVCLWAQRTFELLPPAMQRDIDATRTAVQSSAIAAGWSHVQQLAAVAYAVEQSRKLIAAEAVV